MALVWPVSLPDELLLDGASVDPKHMAASFQGASGQDYVRAISLADINRVQGLMHLTALQRATLMSFYRDIDKCQRGAVTFIWTRPSVGAQRTYRFLAAPRPVQITPNRFKVALVLEESA